MIDKKSVKRVLVISLSNLGDIILTTPVISALLREFPKTRIDVMVGPAGKEVFEKDPRIFKLIIYDKHLPITQKRRLQLKLKRLNYDLIVDLKNTIFPILLGPRFRTGTIQNFPRDIVHARERHLYRLCSLGIERAKEPYSIYIPPEDESYIAALIKKEKISEPVVVMNPGAKSHLKRWPVENYAGVADRLIEECKASVILIGAEEDRDTVTRVIDKMKNKPYNLVGRTNVRQLAALLKRAKLLITNDSAPSHLGCAAGTKVLTIFGPTDPDKYGPGGEFDIAICAKLSCSPCEKAVCKYNYECMKLISPDEVFEAARLMVEGYEEP